MSNKSLICIDYKYLHRFRERLFSLTAAEGSRRSLQVVARVYNNASTRAHPGKVAQLLVWGAILSHSLTSSKVPKMDERRTIAPQDKQEHIVVEDTDDSNHVLTPHLSYYNVYILCQPPE